MDGVTIAVNPPLTADQLFAFYERNAICETGFGKDTAARVLQHSLCVAALRGDQLVGIGRAIFDGLSAQIMELSLDLELQGAPGTHANGSLLEHDAAGVGRELGARLVDELRRVGATFISVSIVGGIEERFYEGLGFRENVGQKDYVIDERPYVQR